MSVEIDSFPEIPPQPPIQEVRNIAKEVSIPVAVLPVVSSQHTPIIKPIVTIEQPIPSVVSNIPELVDRNDVSAVPAIVRAVVSNNHNSVSAVPNTQCDDELDLNDVLANIENYESSVGTRSSH